MNVKLYSDDYIPTIADLNGSVFYEDSNEPAAGVTVYIKNEDGSVVKCQVY